MRTSIALTVMLSTATIAAEHPDHTLLNGGMASAMSQTVAACERLGMRVTQQTQSVLVCMENFRAQHFTLVTAGSSVIVSWTFEDALGPRAGMDSENSLTLQALTCNGCAFDRPTPRAITQQDRDDMALMNARIASMNTEAAGK